MHRKESVTTGGTTVVQLGDSDTFLPHISHYLSNPPIHMIVQPGGTLPYLNSYQSAATSEHRIPCDLILEILQRAGDFNVLQSRVQCIYRSAEAKLWNYLAVSPLSTRKNEY